MFTLGLSLNCLKCGNGENFPDEIEGCQENDKGTSVLCPEGSNSCMKSTCGFLNDPNVGIFKGCDDALAYPDPWICHPEVNINAFIYFH
jgi:hypothetical protein